MASKRKVTKDEKTEPEKSVEPDADVGKVDDTQEDQDEEFLFSISNLVRLVCLVCIGYIAYTIRLGAVREYGRVIHEFDPWFNYRVTEYLVENGWEKTSTWYDNQSWYPLGRPVGTTVYPGMMVTSATIYHTLQTLGYDVSLNDVCVFVPAGFAVLACTFMFFITKEISKSPNAGVVAAAIFAIIPSHLMRSVAGGYDNESVAVTALVGTFFFWVRSLRGGSSWGYGIITGFAYIYMVAAWGGYTFVLNMVGLSALVMVFTGNFSPTLHKAYSLFYIIGTLGAIQFPVVGLAPVKSLEQLGPMGVFAILQIKLFLHYYQQQNNLKPTQFTNFQIKVFGAAGAAAAVLFVLLLPTGYLGPLSSRVRGLFVKHTRTGNPLVDSVAEHQATQNSMYWQYFHAVVYYAPIGFVMLFSKRTNAKWFGISYFVMAAYFSRKMVRLVLLLAPSAASCAGIAIAFLIKWSLAQYLPELFGSKDSESEDVEENPKKEEVRRVALKKKKKGQRSEPTSGSVQESCDAIHTWYMKGYKKNVGARKIFALVFLFAIVYQGYDFVGHCYNMAGALSNPQIMVKGSLRGGRSIMIDDFRESYWWLRDNTPLDSRVMAWWDYGYQINGIANRTTIADGNTWNHEHIALLGKCLVSPIKKAHRITRHLADYVLIWSTRFGGMWGDDLAKSPHMARIANSVYKDVDVDNFYMDHEGNPSRGMRRSMLFNLHSFRMDPSVPNPEPLFKEVYTSKYKMVRIYKVLDVSKKSKKYCKNHPGEYPPSLKRVLDQKQDFAQLEDFNKK